jgi:membrane-bound lytic murein transglycosylase D
MPLELKYLPIIESALNPNAVSRAGATGLWQFMRGTGARFGLVNTSYVDERRDPEKSTLAAIRYLSYLYNDFNDWTLALAAYNCGEGNVKKAIRRSGGKTDYWEIYPYLPRETRGYVPAFIAAMYVMNYYDAHRIKPIKVEFDTNIDTIMVTQRLHFLQISEKLNVPVEQLQALNPQYKKGIIPGNKEKPYSLRLPAATAVEFAGIEKEIYGYKDSLFFDSNFALSTPQLKKGKNGKYTTAQYVAPSEKGKTKISYTVKEGDTYGFIASWYDVRVSDLKYWNDAYSNRLSVGQNITVLVPSGKASKYANINTMTFDQKQAAEGKSLVAETVAVSFSSNRPTDSNYVWYKIQQGDNLWTISQKYPGTSDQDIKAINGFSTKDLRKLQAGMYIKIKRK